MDLVVIQVTHTINFALRISSTITSRTGTISVKKLQHHQSHPDVEFNLLIISSRTSKFDIHIPLSICQESLKTHNWP